MIILLSPVIAEEPPLILSIKGQVVTVNGEDFDFGIIPSGYTLPRGSVDSPWFAESVITRDHDGVLTLPIRFPYPEGAGEDMRFPAPILVTQDGPVGLPFYIAPEVPNLEDFPGPSGEDPDTGEFGSTDVVPDGYTVPSIDGLDGDPAAGDEEADSRVGVEEAGGSPVESDRGDR